MNMKVLNKRHGNIPKDAVYVGRPTKWGNPFSHLEGTLAQHKCASREEAVQAHKDWIDSILEKHPEKLQIIRQELGGKDLVCWCAPLKCHADYLLELANQ